MIERRREDWPDLYLARRRLLTLTWRGPSSMVSVLQNAGANPPANGELVQFVWKPFSAGVAIVRCNSIALTAGSGRHDLSRARLAIP